MVQKYNNPTTTDSSIGGGQIRYDYYHRKALIEAAPNMVFSKLSDTITMPKHMGKTIKCYDYIPMLDDRNVNLEGINAQGVSYANGNMYGSSTDVGVVTAALPTLSEEGGRVNRVGFTRITKQGSLKQYGLFHEYTNENVQFDTDDQLYQRLSRESIVGANQISEALLQIDLLNAAGTVRYAGDGTSRTTMDTGDVVTYRDFMQLSIDLDKNKTPRDTKIIEGSRMIDTRTISAARYMYIHPDLEPLLQSMTAYHGLPALIPVKEYADAGNIMPGEIGSIYNFRIIVNQEMFKYDGVGAAHTGTDFLQTNGKLDVHPMLVVGSESFSTIGFQQHVVNANNESTEKFKIISKKPGPATATRYDDPYGQIGFMSIMWYYGTLVKRPERIAVMYTAVPTT